MYTSPLVLLRHFPVLQIPVLQIQLSRVDFCNRHESWGWLGISIDIASAWFRAGLTEVKAIRMKITDVITSL